MRDAERVLEPLGIAASEEAIYLALVRSPGCDLAALARAASVTRAETQQAIASLQRKGLITTSATRVPKYFPAPPEPALEALILERERELQEIRVLATEMMRAYANERERSGENLVEIVSGPAILDALRNLEATTVEEAMAFAKGPYLQELPETPEATNPDQMANLERGVRYRVVYERAEFETDPEMIRHVEWCISKGEEARVFGGLPLKLHIVDRKVALVPLSLDDPSPEHAMLVRARPLVAALVLLFESVWERSSSLESMRGGGPPGTAEELTELQRQVLARLGAGMKDATIGRHLGISERTVRRHVAELLQILGAATRFEAGARAAHRGWL
jgi:sugar-specific transcriptional regulator TrmB/DNA-binding CsgD family transcriptional regulator